MSIKPKDAIPYSLGEVVSAKEMKEWFKDHVDGDFITIDAERHGALAFVVWRSEGAQHTEEQHSNANFIVHACNNFHRLEKLLQDSWFIAEVASRTVIDKTQFAKLLQMGINYNRTTVPELQMAVNCAIAQYFADVDAQ